jgi:HTH-type transcriptional regulator/antitoxin HigA
MIRKEINTFNPDYAVHPGEILDEILSANDMKKAEFAERSGLSVKTVSQIINCKDPVTAETAIKIERVLGIAASLWNNLDANYRLYLVKEEEIKKAEQRSEWVRQFPINDLIRRGFIKKPLNLDDKIEKMFNFFSVASVDAYYDHFNSIAKSVAFRRSKSFKSAPSSVATWLRIGELLSSQVEAASFDEARFKAALPEIRKLTNEPPEIFQIKMEKLCRSAGVILLFVPEFKQTCIFGVTRWLAKDKALIMLSLRYKKDDHFWFSFYHEAAHVLLHGKKKIFIDEEEVEKNQEEEEANKYASEILIPESKYKEYIESDIFSKINIRNFAKKIGIAPGIVVGRLQHDKKISYREYNDLKRSFKLVEPFKGENYV